MISSCHLTKSTSKVPNAKYQILQHFFSASKKYFNLIRDKLLDRINITRSREQKIDERNYTTKTFFNFSYKRYRFYFGIFIPCNYHIKHDLSPDLTQTCLVPSPIVMSNFRQGCGLHFHEQNPLAYLRRIDNNNKAEHANLLYQRWSNKEKQIIVSRRTGVSYTKSYTARNVGHILQSGHRHMYNLKLNGFCFTPSSNEKTAKKQKARFERSCKRVFNSVKLQLEPVSTTQNAYPSH
ncbi:hypothetical protein RhiirA4_243177 [Rhizophagus irregularis]|uniref:DUF8211 domain-containing protein n=1 Tax=Rhizophagus irregularis TaxID=588596 RepID=A0A2I1GRM4_9GLOM|nr:hypothetical protein RhiirA4_243177 [Rhizophagus irregularis]